MIRSLETHYEKAIHFAKKKLKKINAIFKKC